MWILSNYLTYLKTVLYNNTVFSPAKDRPLLTFEQKKPRRPRTIFSASQLLELEERFRYQKYLSTAERSCLAFTLGMCLLELFTYLPITHFLLNFYFLLTYYSFSVKLFSLSLNVTFVSVIPPLWIIWAYLLKIQFSPKR